MNKLTEKLNLKLLAGVMKVGVQGTWSFIPYPVLLRNIVSPFRVFYTPARYRFINSLIPSGNRLFAKAACIVGGSVDFEWTDLTITYKPGTTMGFLRGNNTNWTLNGDLITFTNVTNTVSEFHFTPAAIHSGAAAHYTNIWKTASAKYVGTTANRRVISIAPTGSATFAFRLIDTTTGLAVGANTNADAIEITINQGLGSSQVQVGSVQQLLPGVKINMIGFIEQ